MLRTVFDVPALNALQQDLEQQAAQPDLQPQNINPNPKPDEMPVVPTTNYSPYNMV